MSVIPRVGVKIDVTPEMIEAARDVGIDAGNEWVVPDAVVANIYRAMRALEHGPADPGVLQQPGVSPYARAR